MRRSGPPSTERGVPTLHSSRSWWLDGGVEDVWDELTRTDRYLDRWPFLRSFDPGDGVASGAVWRCEIRPPLPYSVRIRVHLDRVAPRRSVEARVSGDVTGEAALELAAAGAGTSLTLVSSLRPSRPLLRVASALALPVTRWGHDAVLDQGVGRLGLVAEAVPARRRRPDARGLGRRIPAR